jgi:ferredoxin, 2Fe-2S
MPKITIPQKNLCLEAPEGINLMEFLLVSGLPVASSCKGEGICSKCFIKVSPQAEASNLEKTTMARNKLSDNFRLCCQITVNSDLTVETSYW